MALFHNVTRGGQVHIHQIRMIRQVLWFALIVGSCLGTGYFILKASRTVPAWAWQTLWEYHVAELNVVTQPDEKKPLVKQHYYPPRGIAYDRTSLSILRDASILKVVVHTEAWLSHLFWKSMRLGVWSMLVVLLGWTVMGWFHRRKTQHRGNKLISPRLLAWKLRLSFKASDLKMGTFPLLKHSETRHILISGAIGAGKSNTFHTLLPLIRKRGNKAIIVDVEGEMVSRYYRQGKDILLNPFDARGVCWDLWQELESDPLYKVFACAVVPPLKNVRDPLWENAARKVLIAALKKFKEAGETSSQKLYETLVYADAEEYELFFRHTEAATFTQEKGEKLTLSVRSSLEQYLEFFKHLPDTRNKESFSLRKWVQSDIQDQWLFISSKEDWRLTLTPLISGWVDIAMSALMSLPKDRKRRLWLVLDELPALNALPCMMSSMSRSRKYGGCILAGLQNFKQLEVTYGRTESEVLMDLFSTKVFFRNSEQGTAEWVARALGEREETEVIENLSYGANTMRDGVSLNQQTKRTPLVIPTEVTMLKDFESFVKLPGHYPVTRVTIPLQTGKEIAPEFVSVSDSLPKDAKSFLSAAEETSYPDHNQTSVEAKEESPPSSLQKKTRSSAMTKEEESPHKKVNLFTEDFSSLPIPIKSHKNALSLERVVDNTKAKEGTIKPYAESNPSSSFDSLSSPLVNLEKKLQPLDAAIKEKYRAALALLLKEALRGRIYTSSSFAARFEGLGGFGGASSIASVIHALSSKNILQYFMNGQEYGFEFCKAGYLWVEGMKILRPGLLDERGQDVYAEPFPTHARDPATGVLKEVTL